MLFRAADLGFKVYIVGNILCRDYIGIIFPTKDL